MSTLTINGPSVPQDTHNMVLRDALLHSNVARAVSVSSYHKIEVGIQEGEYVSWIGTWDQSTQSASSASPRTILDSGRKDQRLRAGQVLVVRVTSNGSPASIVGSRVNFRMGLVGGRAGTPRPLVSGGVGITDQATRTAVAAIERQVNTGGLADWDEPVALQDPDDATYFYPYILDADNSTVTVVSSTSETTLYSVSVPAGLLSGERSVRVVVTGTYLNNDGAGRNLTFAVKYGSTTMWGDLASITNSASTYGWSVSFVLSPKAEATSAQHVNGSIGFFGPAGASVAGYGDFATATMRGFGGDATEDASTTLTLSVTMTHGTSSANLSLSKFHGRAEVN